MSGKYSENVPNEATRMSEVLRAAETTFDIPLMTAKRTAVSQVSILYTSNDHFFAGMCHVVDICRFPGELSAGGD